MSELINRVAASAIVSLNMEEFYPQEERVQFDLADYLFQGLVLREKEFRVALKGLEWNRFAGKWVAVTCSADAIVPTWAFMLVCTYLEGMARAIVSGIWRLWSSTSWRRPCPSSRWNPLKIGL